MAWRFTFPFTFSSILKYYNFYRLLFIISTETLFITFVFLHDTWSNRTLPIESSLPLIFSQSLSPIFRPNVNVCCRPRSNQSTKKLLKTPCGERAQTDNIVSVVRAVSLQIGRNWQCRKFCGWRELPPIFK